MKKIKVVLCCMILCMNLGGCMKRGDRISKWIGSEQDMSDQIMEEIVSALDARDADALKEQFSDEALGEATDLDQQIADLMNFYQGKKQSFEDHATSSDTLTKYGEDVEKSFIAHYTLVTDKETYEVLYDYKVIDKKNRDKEGMNQLELVTQEIYNKQVEENGTYRSISGDEGPGVYMNGE